MTSFHSANAGYIPGYVSYRRYRYNGKERDEETGLYYYGARYYAAWLGRWTAVDPSGAAAGSRYAYVGNHPIQAVDPNGRDEQNPQAQQAKVPDPHAGQTHETPSWVHLDPHPSNDTDYWLSRTSADPHRAQKEPEPLHIDAPPLTAPPGRPATLSEQPLPHGRPLTQQEIAAHSHQGTGRAARATPSNEPPPDYTVTGALSTIGGLGEGALAIGLLFAPEPTGATKALGIALLLHSADTTLAGLLTLVTGDLHQTVEKKAISKAARAAGASPETADVTGTVGDASIGILLTFGAGASLWGTNYRATFGVATSTNYRATFFEAYPELKGQVVVHHAVEQQTLKLYPDAVTEEEIHSLENLRGIPKEVNSSVHLSAIRREWNAFYLENPTATQEQLLDKATEIDIKYGSQFTPKVGQ